MTTAARTFTEASAHWYYKDGRACYELPKKDGSGMKAPTLADARKLSLVPSVTNVLSILDKPALNSWKIEQGVLAVLTTPRLPGEADDAFVHRVLHVERVQEQEAKAARDIGTGIHDALEKALNAQEWDQALAPYVAPVLAWAKDAGAVLWTERIITGDGYGGRSDACFQLPASVLLVDFKTTKRLPDKDSYLEHKLQTSAYAKPIGGNITTGNVYISTTEPGQFKVFTQDDWQTTYEKGFLPVLRYWQWANRYTP